MSKKSSLLICEEQCAEECSIEDLSINAYTECVNICMKTCLTKHFED